MMLIDNYKSVMSKYVQFEGRATRSEYWYFVLAQLIVMILLGIISAIIGDKYQILVLLYALASVLPGLSVTVRRLHDIGKSGWWILINLVPVIGGLWFLLLLVTPSKAGASPAASPAPMPAETTEPMM